MTLATDANGRRGAAARGRLRQLAALVRTTPLHPQWLIFRREQHSLREIASHISGRIVDVGCGESKIRAHLSPRESYVGIDFPETARGWYGTRPDAFGDGHRIPLADDSADAVLLLDMLEHLEDPSTCVQEARRILRAGGTLVVQTPFAYPLHDSPRDFTRWTRFGLRRLLEQNGFEVRDELADNSSPETVALLFNLALSQVGLALAERSRWLLVLAAPAAGLFLLANLIGAALGAVSRSDGFLTSGFRFYGS